MQADSDNSLYDLRKPSPNGKRVAELVWQDEYSQGNFTYALVLDGIDLAGRDFVDACAWSDDGRYFAIGEIPSGTNPRDGRFVALVIDVEQQRVCILAHPAGLGLLPEHFAGAQLVCRVWQNGAEWTTDTASLQEWLGL